MGTPHLVVGDCRTNRNRQGKVGTGYAHVGVGQAGRGCPGCGITLVPGTVGSVWPLHFAKLNANNAL